MKATLRVLVIPSGNMPRKARRCSVTISATAGVTHHVVFTELDILPGNSRDNFAFTLRHVCCLLLLHTTSTGATPRAFAGQCSGSSAPDTC